MNSLKLSFLVVICFFIPARALHNNCTSLDNIISQVYIERIQKEYGKKAARLGIYKNIFCMYVGEEA
mgnify:CR=1 FL=1